MFPLLLDLGVVDLPLVGPTHLFLPTYGVLFALSALVAWWWFLRRAQQIGVPQEVAFNLSFVSLLAGILGAKITLIAIDWRYYAANPAEILASFRSAGVLMGGLAAGAIAFVVYGLRHRVPFLRLGDAVAAPLALAQSIGRLGCYAAGCCWGVPLAHDAWWATTFTSAVATEQTGVPLHVPLFPAQLVQWLSDLVLAGILTWLWRRRPQPPGTVFWWYLLLYAVSRGTIEIWRGDAARGLWFGGHLSTSQVLSIVAALIAIGLLLHGRQQVRRTRTRPLAESL